MNRTVSNSKWGRGLVVGVLLAAAVAGCGNDDSRQTERRVSRGDVAERGEELLGQTVTVTGVVNDGSGQRALEIAGAGTFFDGADVLVVGHALPSVGTGARVEVTGTVRRFELAKLEQEVGGDLPVEPGAYDVAIVAHEVKLVRPGGTFEVGPAQ